eukprot:TRINITY_DN6958_c0_g1_i2.p1 TRINITY_DN6958_c0_g1~~TRINITY_DN6958_c0_g1_i2.p1  ORF type:complete len:267 (-),score=-16.06 TRINITY_DN6958_c0_g1_i2:289-1089(-)
MYLIFYYKLTQISKTYNILIKLHFPKRNALSTIVKYNTIKLKISSDKSNFGKIVKLREVKNVQNKIINNKKQQQKQLHIYCPTNRHIYRNRLQTFDTKFADYLLHFAKYELLCKLTINSYQNFDISTIRSIQQNFNATNQQPCHHKQKMIYIFYLFLIQHTFMSYYSPHQQQAQQETKKTPSYQHIMARSPTLRGHTKSSKPNTQCSIYRGKNLQIKIILINLQIKCPKIRFINSYHLSKLKSRVKLTQQKHSWTYQQNCSVLIKI